MGSDFSDFSLPKTCPQYGHLPGEKIFSIEFSSIVLHRFGVKFDSTEEHENYEDVRSEIG